MRLLDEYSDATDVADFDAWYETLTNEDVCDILSQYEENELFDLYLAIQTAAMPQDWQNQILRAYTVFGADRDVEKVDLEGLDEFGVFERLSERFLREKAEKQLRDPFGRWRNEIAKIGERVSDRTGALRDVRGKIQRGFKPETDVKRIVPEVEKWEGPTEGLKDIEAVKKSLGEKARLVSVNYTEGRRFGKGTADDPIAVGTDYDRAIRLLSRGKHIRLDDEERFRTFTDRMTEFVNKKENEDKGYDMCLASVPNTSLFCKIHKGYRRIFMPQAEGIPDDGTPADAISELDADGKKKKVNLLPQVSEKLLTKLGFDMKDTTIRADYLGATQSQLDFRIVGNDKKVLRDQTAEAKRRLDEIIGDESVDAETRAKVQALRNKLYGDPADKKDRGDANLRSRYLQMQEWNTKGNYTAGPDDQTRLLQDFIDSGGKGDLEEIVRAEAPRPRIMVTRDGYIVDGHHRWAAQLALDAEDGIIGDYEMDVTMVDAEIGEVLKLITGYTEMVGIPPNTVGTDNRSAEQKAKDTAARLVKGEQDLREIIASRTAAMGRPWSQQEVDDFIAELKDVKTLPSEKAAEGFASKLPEGNGKDANQATAVSTLNRIKEVESFTDKKFDPNNAAQMESVAKRTYLDKWKRDHPDAKKNGEKPPPWSQVPEAEKVAQRDLARLADDHLKSGNPAIEFGASKAHDEYRNQAQFLNPDGTRKERVRSIAPKDPNETRTVDILSTPYEDLPPHWKEQNRGAVRGTEEAIQAVEQKTGKPFDPDDRAQMEEAAAAVHEDWKARNDWNKANLDPEMFEPYDKMNDDLQELDRGFVRNALENRKLAANPPAPKPAPEPEPTPPPAPEPPRAQFKEPGPRQTPQERTAAQAEALDKAQEAIRFEKVDSLVQDALDNAKDVIKNGGNTADAVDELQEALWQAKKFDRRGGGRGGDLVKELQKAIWAVQGADQEFRERETDRRIGESRAKQRIRQEAKANA